MRKTTELIWHCSATPEGRKVTVATIRKWHKARGWSDIGYHKVVYLDGSVHDGRPMNKIGAHVKGHNRGTLGYCYIGGVAKDGKTPKDTRTPEQKKTMVRLTREAIKDFGVLRISGHNQYSNKSCPSFFVPSDPMILKAVKGVGAKIKIKPVKPDTPRPAGKALNVGALIAVFTAIAAFVAAFLKAKGVW